MADFYTYLGCTRISATDTPDQRVLWRELQQQTGESNGTRKGIDPGRGQHRARGLSAAGQPPAPRSPERF